MAGPEQIGAILAQHAGQTDGMGAGLGRLEHGGALSLRCRQGVADGPHRGVLGDGGIGRLLSQGGQLLHHRRRRGGGIGQGDGVLRGGLGGIDAAGVEAADGGDLLIDQGILAVDGVPGGRVAGAAQGADGGVVRIDGGGLGDAGRIGGGLGDTGIAAEKGGQIGRGVIGLDLPSEGGGHRAVGGGLGAGGGRNRIVVDGLPIGDGRAGIGGQGHGGRGVGARLHRLEIGGTGGDHRLLGPQRLVGGDAGGGGGGVGGGDRALGGGKVGIDLGQGAGHRRLGAGAGIECLQCRVVGGLVGGHGGQGGQHRAGGGEHAGLGVAQGVLHLGDRVVERILGGAGVGLSQPVIIGCGMAEIGIAVGGGAQGVAAGGRRGGRRALSGGGIGQRRLIGDLGGGVQHGGRRVLRGGQIAGHHAGGIIGGGLQMSRLTGGAFRRLILLHRLGQGRCRAAGAGGGLHIGDGGFHRRDRGLGGRHLNGDLVHVARPVARHDSGLGLGIAEGGVDGGEGAVGGGGGGGGGGIDAGFGVGQQLGGMGRVPQPPQGCRRAVAAGTQIGGYGSLVGDDRLLGVMDGPGGGRGAGIEHGMGIGQGGGGRRLGIGQSLGGRGIGGGGGQTGQLGRGVGQLGGSVLGGGGGGGGPGKGVIGGRHRALGITDRRGDVAIPAGQLVAGGIGLIHIAGGHIAAGQGAGGGGSLGVGAGGGVIGLNQGDQRRLGIVIGAQRRILEVAGRGGGIQLVQDGQDGGLRRGGAVRGGGGGHGRAVGAGRGGGGIDHGRGDVGGVLLVGEELRLGLGLGGGVVGLLGRRQILVGLGLESRHLIVGAERRLLCRGDGGPIGGKGAGQIDRHLVVAIGQGAGKGAAVGIKAIGVERVERIVKRRGGGAVGGPGGGKGVIGGGKRRLGAGKVSRVGIAGGGSGGGGGVAGGGQRCRLGGLGAGQGGGQHPVIDRLPRRLAQALAPDRSRIRHGIDGHRRQVGGIGVCLGRRVGEGSGQRLLGVGQGRQGADRGGVGIGEGALGTGQRRVPHLKQGIAAAHSRLGQQRRQIVAEGGRRQGIHIAAPRRQHRHVEHRMDQRVGIGVAGGRGTDQ